MLEQVKDLISKGLNVDREKITIDTHLQRDLGADSLDAVDLIMEIEDTFNVEIPDDVVTNLNTVRDIVTFLESKN
ncbi:MAG: acyl carrier protein [Bacilli bacterium]|jgi:acyl carrier protein